MKPGIILIHGYTGSQRNLEPLSHRLSAVFGAASVFSILLAGHDGPEPVSFEHEVFLKQISDAAERFIREGREVFVVAHSTGGTLAISSVLDKGLSPVMLVLCATPMTIDSGYIERWKKHRDGADELPFYSVASMISLVNSVGKRAASIACPLLIIQGEKDSLVPISDGISWAQAAKGHVASFFIPHAGHDIFDGPAAGQAIDAVVEAICEKVWRSEADEPEVLCDLFLAEPQMKKFLDISNSSAASIVMSPSGRAVSGKQPLLPHIVKSGPVFANIEVTTRCNLRCRYCSRTALGRDSADMHIEVLRHILRQLPDAYRITFVGLGEPLLNPAITDLIAVASSEGRRTGLVTNAMNLDRSLCRELLKAGLDSIAFSIDSPDQAISDYVRTGIDIQNVLENIRTFVEVSSSVRCISTAVFSAVSAKTLDSFRSLVETVIATGVNVLMLTDLNFSRNVPDTVWKNIDKAGSESFRQTVSYAFSQKLPVLSVHGLEEFGLAERYRDFLLIPPDRLFQRSPERRWCCSPWQTVPVSVEGNVTVCDCQPERIAGDLLNQSLAEIWNGEMMMAQRRDMLAQSPPAVCAICPRF